MAIPQCAMAHPGSAAAILSNCGAASSYQKSCSNATPRLNAALACGEQDTANDTVPRCSSPSDADAFCEAAAPLAF
jgi:hypothetical protein